MTENTFDVGGHKYRMGRLDAFQQLHLVRKLLPLVSSSVTNADQLAALRGGSDGQPSLAGVMGLLGPGLEAFAKLPADDVETIITACLGALSRNIGGDRGWAPIMAGARPMYDDIDLVVMLQLVWRVLEAHFEDFFRTFQRMFPDKGK